MLCFLLHNWIIFYEISAVLNKNVYSIKLFESINKKDKNIKFTNEIEKGGHFKLPGW